MFSVKQSAVDLAETDVPYPTVGNQTGKGRGGTPPGVSEKDGDPKEE